MQTPQLQTVTAQDTPIPTLRLTWWENDTLHSVEIPTAWAIDIVFGAPVYDSNVRSEFHVMSVRKDIHRYLTQWLASIRLNFPERIETMTVSDEPIPPIFQPRAA